jgi:glycosyltransferase involved in cell wall biosynthesis
MARVTVVAAGHIALSPRIVKAADALSGAGYDVRVVSGLISERVGTVDRALQGRRTWRWSPIKLGRDQSPVRWVMSGGRTKIAKQLASAFGKHSPQALATYAYSRGYSELVSAILAEPADFVYAGTNGAISAALDASARAGIPCGIDFEDFHCGELEPTADGRLMNALADTMMRDASRRAALVTAGSAAISAACLERFGREPLVINNVFPLPASPVRRPYAGPLRLYWFSQTIGHGRGIEDAIDAAGAVELPMELHLRGNAEANYIEALRLRAAAAAPLLKIAVHFPTDPDAMIGSCDPFDIGLSAEQGHIPNRAINLSNKALTYPLAGLAVVLTDTLGQKPLADTLDGEAIVYRPGDVPALADGLRRWALDRPALRRSGEAAWEAARARWHWEHPLERDRLVDGIAAVLS